MSPQIERILGYPAERWASEPGFWVEVVHPDDRQAVLEEGGASVDSGEPYRQDYRMMASDGRVVWFHDESVLINDDHGRPLMWQGVMVDITERMEIEVRLREAEEKFRTIVEQNQAIFYTQEIDPETGISQTNYIAPGNTDLIGYPVEEVLADPGCGRRSSTPTTGSASSRPTRRATAELGEHFSHGVPDDPQGRPRRVGAGRGRLVQIGEAGRTGRASSSTSPSARRRRSSSSTRSTVEREATQRLRSLDEMKNTFLQAVSHDLRTPLAAILGLAITLERADVELDEGDTQDLARRIADERPQARPAGHEPARPRPARARHRRAETARDRRRALVRRGAVGESTCSPTRGVETDIAGGREPSTARRSSASWRTCSRTPPATRRAGTTCGCASGACPRAA